MLSGQMNMLVSQPTGGFGVFVVLLKVLIRCGTYISLPDDRKQNDQKRNKIFIIHSIKCKIDCDKNIQKH